MGRGPAINKSDQVANSEVAESNEGMASIDGKKLGEILKIL